MPPHKNVPENFKTEIIRPSGLTEEVFRRIRADIVSLRLPPDTRFSVDGLARTLGVSQTPIREALLTLEAIGLVHKRRHYLGYSTAPLMDEKALGEAFEIRLLLEPYAAGRAAAKISKEQRNRLAEIVSKMTLKVGASTSEEFPYQDAEFHRLIAEACDNQLVAQTLDKLNTHLHIFRLSTDQKFESAAIREHRNIVSLVLKGNSLDAEKAMRKHIKESFVRLQRLMKK